MRSTTIGSADPNFERSLPDATHGNCHLLLALHVSTESLTAFTKVIEKRTGRTVVRGRPVEAMSFQPFIPAIGGSTAAEHGVESCRPPESEHPIRFFRPSPQISNKNT